MIRLTRCIVIMSACLLVLTNGQAQPYKDYLDKKGTELTDKMQDISIAMDDESREILEINNANVNDKVFR